MLTKWKKNGCTKKMLLTMKNAFSLIFFKTDCGVKPCFFWVHKICLTESEFTIWEKSVITILTS